MRALEVTLSLLLGTCLAVAQQPAGEPRIATPRTIADPEVTPLLPRLESMLQHGADGAALLADKDLTPLREVTEFRRRVREHAPTGQVTLVPLGEPGTALRVRGLVTDDAGKAIPGALVYAYHTSAKGWYSDRAPHFASNDNQGGDFAHARLFAYVRTDADGRFVIETIRPGGYPRSTLPEHIHWQVEVSGKVVGTGEVWFDDDPRLTKEVRAHVARGTVIEKPTRDREALVVQPVLVIAPERAAKPAARQPGR